jgi:hypothetical protein
MTTPVVGAATPELLRLTQAITTLVSASRQTGLSSNATALAVLIAAVAHMRVDGLDENRLWSLAQYAVPRRS